MKGPAYKEGNPLSTQVVCTNTQGFDTLLSKAKKSKLDLENLGQNVSKREQELKIALGIKDIAEHNERPRLRADAHG